MEVISNDKIYKRVNTTKECYIYWIKIYSFRRESSDFNIYLNKYFDFNKYLKSFEKWYKRERTIIEVCTIF